MNTLPVILIFDIGKTNKKVLLFDEQYKVLYEETTQLTEIQDEDGFPCEDVNALAAWVSEKYQQIISNEKYEVKAINFSAYGASFVYLHEQMNVLLPLYNYLKPYPKQLQKQFYNTYGGESLIAKQTASPVLGNLNSGMQLYRLKYEKPGDFAAIKYALHLPQYLSFILSNSACTDITSIGCHTGLWDFQQKKYHQWVKQEGIQTKFAALKSCEEIAGYTTENIPVGVGLHDSSAALIPYLTSFVEPFILISTGTWSISINPFNHTQLSDYELHHDCLCYLTYTGNPVKASRLFAGYEHEQQIKRIAAHFNTAEDYFKTITCNEVLLKKFSTEKKKQLNASDGVMVKQSKFSERDLSAFANYEEAYHRLIFDIMQQQVNSVKLVLSRAPVKRIFVDGGFSKNPIYMHLLAKAFSQIKVYAASMAQASSLGAALAIHQHWNKNPLPDNLIELKPLSPKGELKTPAQ